MSNKKCDCGWTAKTRPSYEASVAGVDYATPGGSYGTPYGKSTYSTPEEMYRDMAERARGAEGKFEHDLDAVLGRVKELLMAKNAAYGDAALSPLRFHSSASPVEQLNVRMDDKLSRMARGGKSDEDEPLDYVGYWVLREIAKLREAGVGQ